MPANKNALIRYKTIDRCLRNRFRLWTIDDLTEACSDALYEMEGITKGVSVRTVQGDLQIMRSDKLGYNAPIEVFDKIYYRYADPNYSINEMPLTEEDCRLLKQAVEMLDEDGKATLNEMRDVLSLVRERLTARLEALRGVLPGAALTLLDTPGHADLSGETERAAASMERSSFALRAPATPTDTSFRSMSLFSRK